MHDAVDDGRGGGRIQEHLGPAGERQIRRDDEAPALVAAADEAEQEVGAGLVERLVAELVDDDHVETGELVEFPGQPPLLLRFDEQRGQLGGRQEPDPTSRRRGRSTCGRAFRRRARGNGFAR